MKSFGSLCILFLNIQLLVAQIDTTSYTNRSNPIIAGVEVIGVNILVNRFDAWVQNAEWAKVTPHSWKENLKRGFNTDGNSFGTNFLAHPYHGSIYFNSARSSGLNYWQSLPYTVVGSWMWEYFGETHPASEIDWNSTSYGGFYLGEISHRLSLLLLRDDKVKSNRILRNIGATIINPALQFNNLLNSKSTTFLINQQTKAPALRSQFSAGINIPQFNNTQNKIHTKLHLNYSLIYGDLFSKSKKYAPFDFFVLRSWIDLSVAENKKELFFNVSSHAPIFLWRKKRKSTFSISQHFDYIHNEIFKIGALSLTGDYFYEHSRDNWSIIGAFKAGVIIFGSSSSEIIPIIYPEKEEEFIRDYIYGQGFTVEFELMFKSKDYGKIITNINQWFINAYRDTEAIERTGIVQFNYYYPLWKKSSIGIELYLYERKADYYDIPEVGFINKKYTELKLLYTYSF